MTRQSIPGGPALGIALLSLSFGPSVGAACAPRTVSSALTRRPVEVTVEPPSSADASTADPRTSLDEEPCVASDGEAAPTALPLSWTEVYGPALPFATALQVARDSKRAFQSLALSVMMASDGGVPTAKQFERVHALLDLTSRRFATAYHAPDASEGDRLTMLEEGAQLLLSWSRLLDDAGLARAPAAYRSDSTVALTFEDVADGPAKRWREEGLALLRACVEAARANGLDLPAGRECAAMLQRYALETTRKRALRDSGATTCMCDPGDPLCSAAMGGWCRPE